MKLDFFSKKIKHITFVLLILISFYRSPYILFNGRFIGEEATHHYLYAVNNSFYENLLYFDIRAGYYNFIPNIFTWLATLFPIERAPLITVYGSLFIIILLPYLTLFRDSKLFNTTKKKILGSLVFLISPPFVVELWLNTLNSQIYLCLITILILFMTNLSETQKKINNFIVLVSSFSGIYSCAVIPLFIHKYFKDRSHYNLINVVTMFIANIVQLTLIFYSKLSMKLHESVLSNDYNVDIIPNFIYNIIFKSFLGRDLTHLAWINFNFFGINYLSYSFVILIIAFFFIVLKFKNIVNFLKSNYVVVYLFSIFIIISTIIILGSLHNQIGGRYSTIPGVTLILIIFYSSFKIKNNFFSKLFSLLIIISLFAGAYEFRPKYKINLKNPDVNYLKDLDCLNCPEWKSEVKIWRNDKNYFIKLWPYPRKELNLVIKND